MDQKDYSRRKANVSIVPQTKFLSGWWLTYPSEKYEFVSWDDYSQYIPWFQTTNQSHNYTSADAMCDCI